MNWKKLALCVLLTAPLAAVGCGGDDDTPGPTDMCDTGDTLFYVVNFADIGQADPTGDPEIVEGFNLDDRVSDDADEQGCFKPDFTSPPPDNEPGVDNQLGPILASLGGSFDVAGSIAEALADGSLLLLFEVQNVDDMTNDGCVTVNIYLGELQPGVTAPMLDGSGRIAGGQTFDLNSLSFTGDQPMVTVEGQIVNGRVQGGPVDISLTFAVMDTALTLAIRQAQVRFNVVGGGASIDTGVIGGQLDTEETINTITMAVMDVPESLARSILEGQADLEPDAAGQCQAVSMGLVFEGVPATRGDVVTTP